MIFADRYNRCNEEADGNGPVIRCYMEEKRLTEFAPAERSGWEEIQDQSKKILSQIQITRFMESVPTPLMILNRHRQAVAVNERCRELLGISDDNLVLGSRPGEVLHCEHAQRVSGCGTTKNCSVCGAVLSIIASMDTKKAVSEECLFRSRTEECSEFLVEAAPLEVKGEHFTIFTFFDISTQKRKEALDRIFFHDINNSLMGLKLFNEYLKTSDQIPHDHMVSQGNIFIDRVVSEFQSYQQLVAAERGELEVILRSVSVQSLMDTMCTLFRPVLEKKQVELSCEIRCKEESLIQTDETLLHRVLENMLKNAVEASGSGDRIDLVFDVLDDTLRISVWNPQEMDKTAKLQVFKRSYSTKGKGRGLGTYSIKLLTERYLDGKVEFDSNHECGTTFAVSVPLMREA